MSFFSGAFAIRIVYCERYIMNIKWNKKLPILKLISDTTDEEFLKKCKISKYFPGQTICRQDQVYDSFYVIMSGCVKVCHTSEKGKVYSQAVNKEGDFFGEIEVIDSLPFICEIKAITEVEVIRIFRKDFLKWIKENPDVMMYILKAMCSISYNTSKKSIEDTLYSLKFRVCDYLISCSRDEFLSKNPHIFLGKQYMSENFVVTQRSINRVLKELKDKGLIEVSDKEIKLLDVDGLEREREIERFS